MAATQNLGTLFVKLNANSKEFLKGMSAAAAAVDKFTKETKKLANDIAGVSGAMLALGAAAVKLAAGVDAKAAKSMQRLEKSISLVAVQIFDIIKPAVEQLTKMFTQLANTIAGMDPETKKQIATWAVWVAQLAVASKAIGTVAGLVSGFAGAISALSGAIAAIGLGPLLAVVAAVAAVMAAVIVLHRAWRQNWGGIQEATREAVNWMVDVFGQFTKHMSGVWIALLRGAQLYVKGLLVIGRTIEKITGKKLEIDGLKAGFDGLFDDLKSGAFISNSVKFGKTLGESIGSAAAEEFKIIMKELGVSLPKFGGSAGAARQPSMGAQSFNSSDLSDHAAMADASMAAAAAAEFIGEAEGYLDRMSLSSSAGRAGRLGTSMTQAGASNSVQAQVAGRYRATKTEAVGAGSWGEAQDAIKAGALGALEVGTTLEVWGARMGPMLAAGGQQLLGAVGDLVSSVVQGAQQGGIWGAIIAAFMEIAKKTKAAMAFLDVAMTFVGKLAEMVEPLVAPIFDALTEVLGIVLEIVAPVFEALGPLFEAIFGLIKSLYPILYAIGDVLYALGPIIELVGQVVGVIFKALEPIFEIIAGVLKAVATVILGIIIFLNEIAAAVGDTKARAEADRLKKRVEEMWSRDASASGIAAGAALKKAAADEKAAAAANEVAESLLNVPQGYKVALARYDAAVPDEGYVGLGSGAAAGGGSSGGGGNTMNVYGDYVVNTNTEQAKAAREQQQDRAQRRGSRYGNTGGYGEDKDP